MIIRCWGARGSIPVSGREYLKYGGDTSCIEIRTADDKIIIIDSGTGIRRLGNRLIAEDRYQYNVIFTHAHWDHILGFPFFKPLYLEGTNIQMYGCPFAQKSIRAMISRIMEVPNFPVKFEDARAEISYHEACEGSFTIGSVNITPIILSHPNQSLGYKFVEGERSFVFMTDNELTHEHPGRLRYQDYLDFASGADLLMHDSEYTEEEYKTKKTWGHTAYQDALRFALDAGVKRFGLFHHNQERTDEGVDAIALDCKKIIEDKKAGLECFAVSQEMEIRL